MRKNKRKSPTLIDRFCNRFGPSILKVCRFIDKHTYAFFEGLTSIITFGLHQPQPYRELEETNKNTHFSPHKKRQTVSKSLSDDFKAVMSDFHAVESDISKAVKRVKHENPKATQALQETRNSAEFQLQTQIVRKKMSEIHKKYNHICRVCSHSTVGMGNTYKRGDRK